MTEVIPLKGRGNCYEISAKLVGQIDGVTDMQLTTGLYKQADNRSTTSPRDRYLE